MKLTVKILSLLTAASICLSSCSTIIQGSKQSVTMQSITPGTKILVNGDELGTDMVTTKLKRNKNHTVMFKKEGYETKTVTLEKNSQAGFIVADALIALTGFGLVWIIVDAATGSWNKFEKDKVVVELEPKK
jgi:hypothetical protein